MTFRSFGVLAVALLLSAVPLRGQGPEEILSFDVILDVHDGNRMTVTEQITVRSAGQQIRRGIFRDFPTTFPRFLGLGQIEAPFEVTQVLRDGSTEPWALETIGGEWGRGGVRIRIGDAGVFLDDGVHAYTIRYETARWMEFGDSADALYWNVTGNGWDFPIQEASARVRFPGDVDGTAVRLEAWTGAEGETESAATASFDDGSDEALFRTTARLGPREGLTIRVVFPKGVVAPPSAETRAEWFALDWGGYLEAALMVALVVALYLVMWVLVGRDPPRGPVVVRYEPPRAYSPAAVGYLKERSWDSRLLSATLVSLAVKGALTIRQKGDVWTLRRTDEGPSEALAPEEKRLFDALLESKKTLTISDSRSSKLRSAMSTLQSGLKSSLERDYFALNRKWFGAGLAASILGLVVIAVRDPYGVPLPAWFLMFWLSMWTIGTGTLLVRVLYAWREALSGKGLGSWAGAGSMTLFATPFVVAWLVVAGLLLFMVPRAMALAAALLGLVNVGFYHLLERPTRKGRGVLDEIEGFERFLTATDADRLDRMMPPERTPELFEKYLPYAIALGVENRWAETFEDATTPRPDGGTTRGATTGVGSSMAWYSGGAAAGFAGLAGSLGKSFSSSLSSASSPPPSSGSGGGGSFSGGGSSGGGGGGGGGGGW